MTNNLYFILSLSHLKEHYSKDELIILVIKIFGTFAADANCALTIAETGVSQILIDTLKGTYTRRIFITSMH